jgi:6-phosphogluconolactonase (cycloisomerase 2 family)
MKKILLPVVMLFAGLLPGCGSGSGSSGLSPSLDLQSITVTSAASSVAAGLSVQLTATGNFADGSTRNLTAATSWMSLSTGIATVAAGGMATGVAPGTAQITATSGSIVSGPYTLTVTAPTLVSITVTSPASSVGVGMSVQLTATGNFSDGSTQNLTATASWMSSSIGVATVATGGLATGVAPGVATITATSGGLASGLYTLTVTGAPSDSRYLVYVELSSVLQFAVDAIVPGTGQLRAHGLNPLFGYPGGNVAVQVLPNGKNIVLVNFDTQQGINSITSASLSPTGQVTIGNGVVSFYWVPPGPFVDPLGRFLYMGDQTDSEIWTIPLDSSGNLGTPAVALGAVTNPGAMAVDPAGAYLYAQTGSNNNTISSYSVSASGTLTSIGSVPGPGHILQMLVSPSGNFLYAIDNSDHLIGAYSISQGVLTLLPGSPFSPPPGGTLTAFAIDPRGSYLYLAEDDVDSLFGFTIAADGSLTTMQSTSFAVGQTPTWIAVDAAGQFVYVSNQGSSDIWVYSIANATGYLTKVSEIRTAGENQPPIIQAGAAPFGILSGPPLSFTPTELFVANATSNGTVTQFTIDPATGNLSPLATPIAAGVNPQVIATDPFGLYAYVGDWGTSSLSAFSISSAGLTSLNGPFASGDDPSGITTDISGLLLFATMGGATDHDVWMYDLVSGVPTNGQVVAETDAQPVFISNEPTGQYLYVANYVGKSIDWYVLPLPSGTSGNPAGSVSAGQSQNWIAVDPSGRFLYSADPVTNAVWEFTINTGTSLGGYGTLTPNSTPYEPAGALTPGANSVVVEPSGKYLYATNQSEGKIYAFSIDPSTGLLAGVTVSSTQGWVAAPGPSPSALAVDISGQYLYCVTTPTPGSGTISIYSINLSTGFLTLVNTVPNVPYAAGLTTTGTVQ